MIYYLFNIIKEEIIYVTCKKYKGKYFLCMKQATFMKEGEDFTVGVSLTFRKVE